MQTDPISAAHAYRQALTDVLHAADLHLARQFASHALEIAFKAAESDTIGVTSGFGRNTQTPFVTVAISSPAVQMPASQARQIALQILEAADAAESDGFILSWIAGRAALSEQQAATLLGDFRAYRERLRTPVRGTPLEQLIAAARAAGAEGTWIIRGADHAALHHGWSLASAPALVLAPPHELIVLIRIPDLPGGPDGIEFHGPTAE